MVKNSPTKAGDTRDAGLVPGLGRSKLYLFIYFCPGWVFIAARGLTLGKQGGTSLVEVLGLLIAAHSLVPHRL